MKAVFHVIHERLEAFTGKRGRVEQVIISLLDLDEQPMMNTVDYVLDEGEKEMHAGKLKGKQVEVAIHDVRVNFGGRVRVMGRLLSVA